MRTVYTLDLSDRISVPNFRRLCKCLLIAYLKIAVIGDEGRVVWCKPTDFSRVLIEAAGLSDTPGYFCQTTVCLVSFQVACYDCLDLEDSGNKCLQNIRNTGCFILYQHWRIWYHQHWITMKAIKKLKKQVILTILAPINPVASHFWYLKERQPPIQRICVFKMVCSCCKVYMCPTGYHIFARVSSHMRYIRLKSQWSVFMEGKISTLTWQDQSHSQASFITIRIGTDWL